jgi:hypothetical protein
MIDAGEAVREALLKGLRARRELSGVEGRDGGLETRALPRLSIDPVELSDWSAKAVTGREVRTTVSLRVARGQTLRLPMMAAAVAATGEALAGTLNGGWHVASAVLVRERTVDRADGTRVTRVEHRVRVMMKD